MSQRDVVEHRSWEVAHELANLKRLYRDKLGEDPPDGEIVARLLIEIERLQDELAAAEAELDGLEELSSGGRPRVGTRPGVPSLPGA